MGRASQARLFIPGHIPFGGSFNSASGSTSAFILLIHMTAAEGVMPKIRTGIFCAAAVIVRKEPHKAKCYG